MKTQLLWMLGLCGLVGTAQAQTNLSRPAARLGTATMVPDGLETEPRSTSTTIRKPQRTSLYSWLTAKNRWDTQATVATTTYDAQGRTLSIVRVDSALQVPVSRETYARNTAGSISSYLREQWTGTSWQNDIRYTNVLSAQQQINEQTNQRWDGTAWVNDRQVLITYDSHGQQTELVSQSWTNGAWAIQYGTRNTWTYDAADRITGQSTANYNTLTGMFEPYARLQWTYIGTSLLNDSFTEQLWQNGAWVNSRRSTTLVYDANQRLTYHLDDAWTAGSWQPAVRTTYTYDTATQSSTYMEERMFATAWRNSIRVTHYYDTRGSYLGNTSERWTNNAWVLSSGSDRILTYNATDDVTREVSRLVYTNRTPPMTNVSKVFYSNFQSFVLSQRTPTVAASWQVYPNPTTGRVVLLPMQGQHLRLLGVQVLNGLGQVVGALPAQAAAGRQELDVTSLPAGVYHVRLQTAAGTTTRRLVKQ